MSSTGINYGDMSLYGTLTIGKSLSGSDDYTLPLTKGASGTSLVVLPASYTGTGKSELRFYDLAQPPFSYAKVGTSGIISTTFLNLTDVPSSYLGKSGYTVVVNNTENGLEFTAITNNVTAGDVQLRSEVAGITASLQSQINGINVSGGYGISIIENPTNNFTVAVTGSFGDSSLRSEVVVVTGSLQSQINSVYTTTALLTSNLQSQINVHSLQISNLQSITGNYTLLTTTALLTSNLQSQIDLKATDTLTVHTTGNESITGNKTFTSTSFFNNSIVLNQTSLDASVTINAISGNNKVINLQSTGVTRWQFGSDFINDNFYINSYNSSGTYQGQVLYIDSLAADKSIQVGISGVSFSGSITGSSDLVQSSISFHYFGDPNVDGSWRFGLDSGNMVMQKREISVWNTKHTFS